MPARVQFADGYFSKKGGSKISKLHCILETDEDGDYFGWRFTRGTKAEVAAGAADFWARVDTFRKNCHQYAIKRDVGCHTKEETNGDVSVQCYKLTRREIEDLHRKRRDARDRAKARHAAERANRESKA